MKNYYFVPLLAPVLFVIFLTNISQAADQTENVRNYIKNSDFVVDICIYEREHIPATPDFPKERMVMKAVVTGVHKGPIKVGTKLEYYHLSEITNKPSKRYKSTVQGELRTFFFSIDDGILKNGKYSIEGDGHFGFDRLKGDFAMAFKKELQRGVLFK